jgi:glutamate-ammonia-ligase adenylyltransferase
MEEISDLADGVIAAALERRQDEARGGGSRFCIVAFGKLGGRELNYSSDVDLLGVCVDDGEEGGSEAGPVESASRLMEALRGDLSTHTTEGYAYRVDLRLRPYGTSGQLVFTLPALNEYYGRHAALWEVQALLKARPVAGDPALGQAFLDTARTQLLVPRAHAEVAAAIDTLRREALRGLSRGVLSTTDIKTGLGGLRDVEFLAQGLQGGAFPPDLRRPPDSQPAARPCAASSARPAHAGQRCIIRAAAFRAGRKIPEGESGL